MRKFYRSNCAGRMETYIGRLNYPNMFISHVYIDWDWNKLGSKLKQNRIWNSNIFSIFFLVAIKMKTNIRFPLDISRRNISQRKCMTIKLLVANTTLALQSLTSLWQQDWVGPTSVILWNYLSLWKL